MRTFLFNRSFCGIYKNWHILRLTLVFVLAISIRCTRENFLRVHTHEQCCVCDWLDGLGSALQLRPHRPLSTFDLWSDHSAATGSLSLAHNLQDAC